MLKKITALLFLLFFTFSVSSFSEEIYSESLETLSLKDAFTLSLQSHPIIKAKRSDIEASKSGIDVAKWQRFPSVSSQTLPGRVGSGTSILLRIQQPLWAGGRITSGIDAAEAKAIGSEASFIDAEQQIISRVSNAYFDYLKFQEKIRLSTINIQEHQRLLEIISRRSESEVSSQNEIVMARSRLSTAVNERIQFSSQFHNAKADLEQLTGQKFKKLTIEKFKINTDINNIDHYLSKAVEFSPGLKKIDADWQAAKLQIEVKKASLWPQLSLNVDNYTGSTYPDHMVYLSLGYQSGNGLSTVSSIQEAKSQSATFEQNFEASKKDLQDKLRIDFYLLNTSVNSEKVLIDLANSNKDVYESFLRQYSIGKKTWLEVLNSRKEATQAEYSRTDAKWTSFQADFRIQSAIGAINSTNINNFLN